MSNLERDLFDHLQIRRDTDDLDDAMKSIEGTITYRDQWVMDHDQQAKATSADSATVGLIRGRGRKASTAAMAPAAMAFVIGLAALTAQAGESDVFRDIQRYCTVCWRNARLDPRLWDDCTQEVCCRLLGKARQGELELSQVLGDDTPERRELVRAIDMVRKRVQRSKKFQPIDAALASIIDQDKRHRDRLELGEILEAARRAVLSERQDRIIEFWMRGWTVPEIARELKLPTARVSDEKYKALRKLEQHLGNRREDFQAVSELQLSAV